MAPLKYRPFEGASSSASIHRRGNVEVKVDSPTTELQLQSFQVFVVANRRKRG